MAAIVKLGGSLAAAGTLRPWLDIILTQGGGRAVVVPGGGEFADGVRLAQKRLRFSDRTAHRMALLAMQQYALLLQELAPALRPCADEAQIAAALAAGSIALWLPSAMVEADPAIAESWDVTSDSLAAWLAWRIGATQLVLVKSAPAPDPPLSPERLAALGLVDAAFPGYAAKADIPIVYCGPGETARLSDLLRPNRRALLSDTMHRHSREGGNPVRGPGSPLARGRRR
ncbi:MAG TPA: uridylate kinase [Stellaceae bacterium]|nr:uridylate kinase [Stellaceae bacterium]